METLLKCYEIVYYTYHGYVTIVINEVILWARYLIYNICEHFSCDIFVCIECTVRRFYYII